MFLFKKGHEKIIKPFTFTQELLQKFQLFSESLKSDLRFIVFDFNDPSKRSLAQRGQNLITRLNDVSAVVNQVTISIIFHRRCSLNKGNHKTEV